MTTIFITPILAFILEGESLLFEEILTIISGFIGVMMITNADWFNSDNPGSTLFKRDLNEYIQYPHFNLGVLLAFGFAIFNAMTFIKIRSPASSDMVGSLKTYYFGVLSTIPNIIICLIIQPELF